MDLTFFIADLLDFALGYHPDQNPFVKYNTYDGFWKCPCGKSSNQNQWTMPVCKACGLDLEVVWAS